MAADIKNYLKEKEKRQKNQDDYKKKIRKHKLTIVYRVLLVAAALGAALALVVEQAKRHIYTGYDTVSSVNRETSSDAIDVRLKNGILTYSKDGAHCTDAKGNVKWNQTYVIQDVKLATCGSVARTRAGFLPRLQRCRIIVTMVVRFMYRIRRNSWEPLPRPCQFVILR